MISRNKFEGVLDGKTIEYFLRQLDNNLCQKNRIKLVEDILYTQGEQKCLDKFFEDVFEQKNTKNGVDTSHIKLCVNKADGLSMDNSVCRGLERMADYILYSPDGERINKKTQYNFYPKEIFENRILAKELHLDNVTSGKTSLGDEDEIIDYLIRKGENYKKTIKQVIVQKDIKENNIIREYEEAIKLLSEQLKNEELNNKERKRIGNVIHGMRDDQLMVKDMAKGTIYFKQVAPDTTEIDYDMFDFTDSQHVIALMKMSVKNDFNDDLTCLIYSMDVMLRKAELTEKEKKVLSLWKDKDATVTDIAEKLETPKSHVNKTLNSIANKITKQYWEEYEDWYYLNIAKGKYKTCNQCGEVKLVSKFSPRKRSKDGLESNCKCCEKDRKRAEKESK
jgi:predicted DNA-binding protein YlxM (UPF0122 family)